MNNQLYSIQMNLIPYIIKYHESLLLSVVIPRETEELIVILFCIAI